MSRAREVLALADSLDRAEAMGENTRTRIGDCATTETAAGLLSTEDGALPLGDQQLGLRVLRRLTPSDLLNNLIGAPVVVWTSGTKVDNSLVPPAIQAAWAEWICEKDAK